MLFKYKAKNPEGETREGETEAASQLDLARALRDEGFYLIDVEVMGDDGENSGSGVQKLAKLDLNVFVEKIKGVSLEEKMMFSRNLSVMISSGIDISRALEVLEKQSQSPTFKRTIKKISKDLQSGKNFSDAVAEHPKIFGTLYSSMVKAGEVSGNLDGTLEVLASQLEKQHELRSKVRGAMVYPAVIIIAMIGIGILMMIMVVPQLKSIFGDLGVDLPVTTQAIITVSDFLTVYWWAVLAALPFFIFLLKKFLSTENGKRSLSFLVLHIPLFKELSHKINNAAFARTLSSLISGGVPILEGLGIVSETLNNVYYRESLESATEEVKKGKNLYEVLDGYSKLYTPLMLEMIQVGEESGKLSDLLSRVAEFYEREVSDTTDNMSSIIEPILMLFIGGAVGFFAISIMQPIYGMLGSA
ncbi:MAG: type II secretion system F family protein [Candidatus Spechtbacterales bacterium]